MSKTLKEKSTKSFKFIQFIKKQITGIKDIKSNFSFSLTNN